MILALLPLALAWQGDVEAEPLAVLLGSAAEEHLRGPAISADLDRDGVPELLIGNHQGFSGAYAAGEVYLLSAPVLGEVDLNEVTTIQGDEEHDYLGVDLAASAHGLWVGADRSGLTSRDPGAVALFREPAALAGRVALSEADLVLSGDDNGDALGRQLEVGDFDGDGQDDLAVSAPIRDSEGQQRRGAVWWVLGEPEASGVLPIGQLADASTTGADARAWAGWRLAAPGDLDGDGRDDLVVGVLGEGETFGGRLYALTAPGAPLSAAWESPAPGSRAGEGLSGGDLDGDGVAELLVGSPWVDRGAGRVWLVSGAPQGVEDLDAAAVAVAEGLAGEGLGASVALGPVLLAGAPYGDTVVVFDDNLSELGRVSGPTSFGAALAWTADLDADGVQEALMFATDHGITRERQGVAWLTSGAALTEGSLPEVPVVDADGDGTSAELDCDDGDPLRHLGPEICRDDVDNDCDWIVDEDDCQRGGCSTLPRGGGAWLLGLLALVARRRSALALGALALTACAEPPLELTVPPGPLSGTVAVSLSGNYDQLVIEADGVVLGGGPGPALSVGWDTSTSAPGLVTVRGQGFSGSDDPVEVSQQVEVGAGEADETPPTVGFLAPLAGDVIPMGEAFFVEVDALDAGGLARVALSVDGALLGELPGEGPFEWAWTPAAEGPATLSVEAEDLAGNLASAGVQVDVASDGSISCVLSAPVDGATVSGEVTIRAAISAEGGVQSARFFVDGLELSEDSASPWEARWDSSEAIGLSVTLSVEGLARDGSTCTDAVEVDVEEGGSSDFDVRITQPTEGASVFGVAVPVRVAAGGGQGVAQVELRVDGVRVDVDETAPYEFSVDSTQWPDGPLVIEAIGEELNTGLEVSDEVEVSVENAE